MANTLKINTRLLEVNWTTGTSYTINLGSGLVREQDGNRSPSAAQLNAKTFTTFSSGPTIASVAPTLGTSNSYVTTASLTYNRPVFLSTNTYNVYLYKENLSGTDELVATIPSNSSRFSRVERTLNIDLKNLLDGNSTYYLESDSSTIEDMFRFAAEKVSESKFKYSTAAGPQLVSKTPTSTATNTFVTTATLNFDKSIFTDTSTTTNSVAVYKSNNDLFDRLYTTSSAISVASTALNISLLTKPMPEGEYYITMNKAFVRDQYTFPAVAQTATDFLKILQTSASNMIDREYATDISTRIFSTSTPVILDVDLDANKQYTFTLSCNSGSFTATSGTLSGNTWTYVATKADINAVIDDIYFKRPETYRNNDISYTYSLSKDSVTLVEKTKALNGIPMAFAGTMTIVPPSQTFYQLEPAVTVSSTISSGSNFSGQVSIISTSSTRRNVIFVGGGKFNTAPTAATADDIIPADSNYSSADLYISFQNASWDWPYGAETTSSYQGFVVGEPVQIYSDYYEKFDNYIVTEISAYSVFPDPTTRFQIKLSYDFGDVVEIDPEWPQYDTWYGRTYRALLIGVEQPYPVLNAAIQIRQGTYASNSYQGNFFNPTVLATEPVTGTNFINYSLNPEQFSTTQTYYLQSYWAGGLDNSNGNKFIGTDSNIVSYTVSTASFTLQRIGALSGGQNVGLRTYNTQTFVATANTVTNGLKTIQLYLLVDNEIATSAYTVGNTATFVIQPGYFSTGTEYTFKTLYSGANDLTIYSNSFNLTASE